MCGRYYRRSDKQQIAEAFRLQDRDETGFSLIPSFNIAPTTVQPVIRQNRDTLQREMLPMRWGMVGFGSKGPDPKRSTFNARCETLESSGLWRSPFHRHRCIIPADGFYEWQKPTRQPWRFALSSEQPIAFAGLWDAWKDPANGQRLQSFAIITVPANELMAPIHDRMPAMLQPHEYDRWLDREEVERVPGDLLRPFDSHRMVKFHAHSKVGNVRNQGAEMLNSA